jgi:hypothetical protein
MLTKEEYNLIRTWGSSTLPIRIVQTGPRSWMHDDLTLRRYIKVCKAENRKYFVNTCGQRICSVTIYHTSKRFNGEYNTDEERDKHGEELKKEGATILQKGWYGSKHERATMFWDFEGELK